MGRRRFVYSAEGRVTPERFIAALTDFSDDRPKYWPGQTRNQFRLIEKGMDWALVQEGTATMWEQSRYDWSKPGLVVATVAASNFLKPGTTTFRVSDRPDGGCRVDVVLERDFTGLQGGFVEASHICLDLRHSLGGYCGRLSRSWSAKTPPSRGSPRSAWRPRGRCWSRSSSSSCSSQHASAWSASPLP